jgi:hypothetical protein
MLGANEIGGGVPPYCTVCVLREPVGEGKGAGETVKGKSKEETGKGKREREGRNEKWVGGFSDGFCNLVKLIFINQNCVIVF